jgi:putative ABC transport system ATP-binding protein
MFRRLPFFGRRQIRPNGNGRYHHGNDHLIEMRAVAKTFHTAAGEFQALKGVDLTVETGEFVAIIGKSGSGKSTLVNMITGIDRPTSGEVYVGDTAVHTLNEGQIAVWRGKHIGVIFQFFQLLPTLTLIENVMLPMDFCNIGTMGERRDRALHLLEQVEMAGHAHKLPSACSGGQQQRVAIARALANDPPIITADEPTGNLDSRTAETIFDLFQSLVKGGKTIVMVTHDRDLSRRVTRSIIIADGEIVEETCNPVTVNGRPATIETFLTTP